MTNIINNLRAAIAADPEPECRCATQGSTLSAAARRNRVRIGLPEYPTQAEMDAWAARRFGK